MVARATRRCEVLTKTGILSPKLDHQNILVVDDDPKICTLLRNLFEGAGYRVSEAQNADEALDLVAKEHPDLVTLDLQLGREDGLDVARAITGDLDRADCHGYRAR